MPPKTNERPQNGSRHPEIPKDIPVNQSGYPDMTKNESKDWVNDQVEMASRTRNIPNWVPRSPDGTIDESQASAIPFLPVQRQLQDEKTSWFSCFGLCPSPYASNDDSSPTPPRCEKNWWSALGSSCSLNEDSDLNPVVISQPERQDPISPSPSGSRPRTPPQVIILPPIEPPGSPQPKSPQPQTK